jgi:hypothetical protein
VNIRLAFGNLTAALVLIGMSALASAAEKPSGPIVIQSFEVSGVLSSYDPQDVIPASAAIAFENQSDTPATDVVFALEENGTMVEQFTDVGWFAKGVTIRHRFPEGYYGTNQRAGVAKATFSDGTIWTNPTLPTAVELLPSPGVAATFRQQMLELTVHQVGGIGCLTASSSDFTRIHWSAGRALRSGPT